MRVARRSEFAGWTSSASPASSALIESTLRWAKAEGAERRGVGGSLFSAWMPALGESGSRTALFRLSPTGLIATLALHLLVGGFLFFHWQSLRPVASEQALVLVKITQEKVEPRDILLPEPTVKIPTPEILSIELPDIQQPPSSAAITVPIAAPPAASVQNAIDSYRAKVLRHLKNYKRYPLALQNRREQGVALLSFTIDTTGRLLAFHIVRTSGSAGLDAQVLDMIQRASPIPPPPPELAQGPTELVVPVEFSLP